MNKKTAIITDKELGSYELVEFYKFTEMQSGLVQVDAYEHEDGAHFFVGEFDNRQAAQKAADVHFSTVVALAKSVCDCD